MTPDQETRARKLIEKHVQMSGQTLDALRKAGLSDDRAVQLDFFFGTSSEKVARALMEHLRTNDCVDLSMSKAGGFLSRRWVITGRTHPTPVTAVVLRQWIPWIVVQGVEHGCDFDGWGTEV